MSQIDLLLSNEDREQLLQWILAHDASIIPDMHYREPHYRAISSVQQIGELIDYRQFFVLRSDWQLEGLQMRSVVNKTQGPGYYIAQRYGGPSINLLLYPESNGTGKPALGRGAVHYYPYSYSTRDKSRVAPPAPMQKFFAELVQFLKSGATCLKGKERSVYLRGATASAVASEEKHVPSEWQAIAGEVFAIRQRTLK